MGREIDSLRRVLFALLSQRNYMLKLDADLLAKYRDHPHRAYRLGPAADYTPATPVDLSDLLFLMATSEAAIIPTVQLADARYHAVLGLLRERSANHQLFQAKLEAASFGPGKAMSFDEIREVAGPVLAAQLEGGTDHLYAIHKGAHDLLEEAYESLERFWRRRYPTVKLPPLTFTPIEPLAIPSAPGAPPSAMEVP